MTQFPCSLSQEIAVVEKRAGMQTSEPEWDKTLPQQLASTTRADSESTESSSAGGEAAWSLLDVAVLGHVARLLVSQ